MFMSHIPSSAMPHAKVENEEMVQSEEKNGGFMLAERADKIGDQVKEVAGQVKDFLSENRKTAMAAGAVAVAGGIAAAVLPMVRGRSEEKSGAKKSSGTRAKSSSNKSSARKS
jgi:hypothetical protein